LQSKKIMTTDEFHAGNLIRAELTSQGKSIVWLAKELHRSPSCMYRMLKKKHLNMKTFIEICVALEVNLCGCFCEDIEKGII